MWIRRFAPPAMLAVVFALAFTLPAVGADTPAEKKAQRQKLKEEQARKAAEAKAKAEAEAKASAEAKAKAEADAKKNAESKKSGGKTLDVAAVTKLVDAEVDKRLAAERLEPSVRCDDAEFVRRAYLDITGVIPTAEKAKAFLDDTSPDKRAKLLDRLLDDPNYGRKNADVWVAKLYPRDSNNRFITPEAFHTWIAGEFNANTRWDAFVTKVVTASGTVDEHPEVTFYLANRSIDKLTDAVTQHFLGVRLSCAQCHNHPFTSTKQKEYWGMAAFFSKVNADKAKNANKGGDNSDLGVREGSGPSKAKDFFPESAKQVTAKFLGGDEPKLDPKEPYRPVLARWMTAPDNPYLSRAAVNRTWAQLFGNGLVDPVDDLIPTNQPSHPDLLDKLAKLFAEGGFDLKALIRGICLSDAYQRSARPNPTNKQDAQLFSHVLLKQMTAEQLYDSLQQVLGAEKGSDRKVPNPTGKGNTTARDRFVQFYQAGAEEQKPTEYEAGIPQVLRQLNSNNARIASAAKSITAGLKTDAAVERLYLTTLSRRPTADEAKRLAEYVAVNPTDGYADILWAVLNSSEFAMIR